LPCAHLDHLVFLPAGDAALTRRSGKYSTLAAVALELINIFVNISFSNEVSRGILQKH
jgi:hypothetical protein